MLARHASELRTVATFGIAVFAPLALVSFLGVLATSISGVPGWVMALAVFSIPLVVLFVALYIAVDLVERYTTGGRIEAPADGEGLDSGL